MVKRDTDYVRRNRLFQGQQEQESTYLRPLPPDRLPECVNYGAMLCKWSTMQLSTGMLRCSIPATPGANEKEWVVALLLLLNCKSVFNPGVQFRFSGKMPSAGLPGPGGMMADNGTTQFSQTLKRLRLQSGKSRYKLAQYSGISEAYLLRLESGECRNPSRDMVIKIALALVSDRDSVSICDVNGLLSAGDYAALRGRGESIISG